MSLDTGNHLWTVNGGRREGAGDGRVEGRERANEMERARASLHLHAWLTFAFAQIDQEAPLRLRLYGSLSLGVEVGTLCTCLRSRSIVRAARWQPGRRFFRGASWSWSADDGVMHGRGGPPRLTRPSEERSMNIIRVIFVMALELTVIYTRETDRVPMTASDLSRPSLPVDREGTGAAFTAACTAGLGARGKRKPKPTETKGGGLLILLPASLLRDLPGFAIRGNRPGRRGTLPARPRPPPSVWNFQSHTGLSAIAF